MTETEPVYKVYDLTYPSPVTLKEISAISVAVNLWREEICVCLNTSENSDEFNLTKNILLKNVIPNLPSAINSFLEEYVTTFGKSIVQWMDYNNRKVFVHCYGYKSTKSILSRFHDFAWDWDGTIHYPRTAKRMILCDRLSEDEKFRLACLYCFEDDIKRIWPSVRTKMGNISDNVFFILPQWYYWICYLRNELYNVPRRSLLFKIDLDEMMLHMCESNNQSCMMYFWNRIPPDRQPQIDTVHFRNSGSYPELFVRFILPTLNECQLEIFVAKNGGKLMWCLLSNEPMLPHVIPTWMYIRDKMNESDFIRCVRDMLLSEISPTVQFPSRSVAHLFGEIWKSAPQHLKQSALNDVLYNERSLYDRSISLRDCRAMKFLIVVLQDATLEERNAFWLKYWRALICGVPIEDSMELMKLCFRNENEIIAFRENTMARLENIAEWCLRLLERGSFEALSDFLSVCCPDVGKRRQLKRRLLRSNYIGENTLLTMIVFKSNKLLNELIDDAFQDAADLGVEFRNQFASSSVTRNCLFECIRRGKFVPLMDFVDTFFSEEQAVVSVKKRLVECFKERLIDGSVLLWGSDDLQGFFIWLLGSEDEVTKFKQSIPVQDIFRAMIATEMARDDGGDFKREFPAKLDVFLLWYFNDDEEEIEKFTELFLDELKSFRPRKCGRIV